MRKSSVPRRRYQNLSWISVEEDPLVEPIRLPATSGKRSIFYQSQVRFNDSFSDNVNSLLTKTEETTKEPKAKKATHQSLIPKSSNFVCYSSDKYHCPYYIKPQLWGKFNSAPRYDEQKEREKINNFYNYMHERFIDPNPFRDTNQNEDKQYEVIQKQLGELPSLQKYKK